MKILYIGNSDINGYSYYQYKIIKNIFKNVTLLDLDKAFGRYNTIANAIAWKISPIFFSYFLLPKIKQADRLLAGRPETVNNQPINRAELPYVPA